MLGNLLSFNLKVQILNFVKTDFRLKLYLTEEQQAISISKQYTFIILEHC